jgi:hypothetical protein
VKNSWKRRRWTLWLMLVLLGGAVWLGVYAWDQGFTKKWRGLIAKELAKHGLRAEIGRLTLDPVEGLTARDVNYLICCTATSTSRTSTASAWMWMWRGW